MSLGLLALIIFTGAGVGLWLVSHILEPLRPVPQPPVTLRWAPEIPIDCLDIGG